MRSGNTATQSDFPLQWADAVGPHIWLTFATFACILIAQWLYIRHLTKPTQT